MTPSKQRIDEWKSLDLRIIGPSSQRMIIHLFCLKKNHAGLPLLDNSGPIILKHENGFQIKSIHWDGGLGGGFKVSFLKKKVPWNLENDSQFDIATYFSNGWFNHQSDFFCILYFWRLFSATLQWCQLMPLAHWISDIQWYKAHYAGTKTVGLAQEKWKKKFAGWVGCRW